MEIKGEITDKQIPIVKNFIESTTDFYKKLRRNPDIAPKVDKEKEE